MRWIAAFLVVAAGSAMADVEVRAREPQVRTRLPATSSTHRLVSWHTYSRRKAALLELIQGGLGFRVRPEEHTEQTQRLLQRELQDSILQAVGIPPAECAVR